MSVDMAITLQTAVYTAVAAAVADEGLVVTDHVPINPGDEHVRLDGFSIADRSSKNTESGRHSFQVHVFVGQTSSDASGTQGQSRIKTLLAMIHVAVMALTVNDQPIDFEVMDMAPDMASDLNTVTQHGLLRYSLIL